MLSPFIFFNSVVIQIVIFEIFEYTSRIKTIPNYKFFLENVYYLTSDTCNTKYNIES